METSGRDYRDAVCTDVIILHFMWFKCAVSFLGASENRAVGLGATSYVACYPRAASHPSSFMNRSRMG